MGSLEKQPEIDDPWKLPELTDTGTPWSGKTFSSPHVCRRWDSFIKITLFVDDREKFLLLFLTAKVN